MNEQKPTPKDSQPARDVPRDARLEGDMPGRGQQTPRPEKANIRDEDYTDRDKPLLPGSPEAKALQAHPPKAKGELDVGTAGDAARPSKTGVYGKPIPPRGRV